MAIGDSLEAAITAEGGVGPRAPRRRKLIVFNSIFGVCLLALVGVGAALRLGHQSRSRAPSTPAAAILPLNTAAPNFVLTGQFGQPVALHDYRGKAVVIAFVDSRCSTICPLTTSTLTAALADLGANSPRVKLLGINANPLATSVGDVHAYSAAHDLLYRWDFLTGSKAQLATVWRAYHVYAAAIGNNIDHDPAVIVIDPAGRQRAVFHTAMSYSSVAVQAAQLARAVGASLGVKAAATALPAPTSVLLPSVNVSLPVVAGASATTVEIGPGHPHLLVFLASWLTESSNLKSQVAVLNDYQRAAQQRGLPTLVAIDLTTTEPDGRSLAHTLSTLGVRPGFPVVSDSTGAVADGYQAQDCPWYSVTAQSGELTWQHDGWLTAAALLNVVTKAARY